MKDDDSSRLPITLLLGLILCAAFFLRAWDLDRGSLWEDEYHGVDRALMEPARMFQVQKYQGPSNTSFDLQPPLFYAVEHLVVAAWKSAYAARMVSVLAGILTIAALFFLGKRLFGEDAGLYAAVLCALSLFHMGFSRSIKPYSLFFLLYVSSLLFLILALERKKAGYYACYVLTAAGMLYASFIGVPVFASHVVAVALFFSRDLKSRVSAATILRRARPAILAFLAVCALFLPMAGSLAFMRDFLHEPGAVAILNLSANDYPGLVSGFFFQYFEPNAFWWTLYPLAVLLGAAGCLLRGARFPFLALCLASFLPVTAAFVSPTRHVLECRHLPTLFFFIILMLACLIALITRALSEQAPPGPGKRIVSATLGMGLSLFFSLPGLSALGDYHAKYISNDKQTLFYLAVNKNNIGYLDFQGFQSHPKRVGAAWYLPGLFSSFSDFAPSPYKRSFFVINSLSPSGGIRISPYARLRKTMDYSIFHTEVFTAGLLNRSPILVDPAKGRFTYEDDFSTLRLFSDCRNLKNAAPDLERGLLAPLDAALPAEVVYEFKMPRNVAASEAILSVRAALFKRNPKHRSDSKILVAASPDGKNFEQVGLIGFEDFLEADGRYVPNDCPFFLIYYNSKCKSISKEYNLPAPSGSSLFVRLTLAGGEEEGNMLLDAFRLSLETNGAPGPRPDSLAGYFDNVSENACLAKWKEGVELALSDCVHAFDLSGRLGCEDPDAACNPSGDLAKYKAAHPGAAPVYALSGRNGEPGAEFYDPSLSNPFITLSAATPSVRVDRGSSGPLTVKSLRITGRLDVPSFTVNGRAVAVPVYAPSGSTLVLNAGGEGRLYLNPVFTREKYDPDSFLNSYNMTRNERPGEDGCLTCREDYRCFFTYSVISAFPIREVLFENHLRIFMDPEKANGVKVLVSSGDDAFVPIETFTSDGSGIWKYSDGSARVLSLQNPVSAIKIRFELTGQGAQVWSADRPIDDMRIACALDAGSFTPFVIENREFSLSLDKTGANEAGFFFSGEPERFYDDLRFYR